MLLASLTGCGPDKRAEPAANDAAPAIEARIADETDASNAANIAAPAEPEPSPAAAPPPAPKPARPVADYRAIGTEPFWAVTIRGGTATLERPDHPALTVDVVRIDNGGAVSWRGEGFSLRITPGPCSDGMSDAIWSDRAQVATGTLTLKGCGGERDGGEGDR